MKKIAIISLIVGFLVILPIGAFVLKVVLLPWFAANQGLNSAYDVTKKTLDADNVIYNYEWFKQQYEDIEATKKKRDILEKQLLDFKKEAGPRKNWTFEDKQSYSQLRTTYIGLSNYLQDLVANYNARSKMANRNIFKDGLIPSSIEFTAGIIK